MTRIRVVDKDLHKIYLEKASEFFTIMKYTHQNDLWIATGLNGIHCVISCCDAVTAFYLGTRSASTRHEDVIVLLRKLNFRDIEVKIKQIMSILSVKNVVEYEAREFRDYEARKITTRVERIYNWAIEILPK